MSNEMPPCGDFQTQPTHRPSCAVEGANYRPHPFPPPPFSLAEDAHPALHFRSLLLKAGDVEGNPVPVCRECTKTVRRDITSITRSSCSQPYHNTCSGLTPNKKGTQSILCRHCAGLAAALPSITKLTQVMETNKQCCVCSTT